MNRRSAHRPALPREDEFRSECATYTYRTTYWAAAMAKKLTITVDADVYEGLHRIVGRRRISRFLNDLARQRVIEQDVADGYAAMAADEARETEAEAWSETLLQDVADEPRRYGG